MHHLQRLIGRTWRHFMHDSLYRNSIYLMADTALLSATGFLFWIIAARTYSPEAIGIANTVIIATTFLSSIGFLGLDYALIRFLPTSQHKAASRISSALSITAVATIVVSLVYLLFLPLIVTQLDFMRTDLLWAGLFVVAVLATSWNMMTNSIFIAMRVAQFVLITNIIFGILRLPLLLVLGSLNTFGLFLAHAIGLILSVVLSLLCIRTRLGFRVTPQIKHADIHDLWRYSSSSYVANIVNNLPLIVIPIIILHTLGPKFAAFYAIPMLIRNLLNIIPVATSQAMFAEGSSTSSQHLASHFRKSALAVVSLMVPAVALLALFGNLILNFFGGGYASHGYGLLVLLGCASLIKSLSYLIMSVMRIKDEMRQVVIASVASSILTVTLGYGAIVMFGDIYWIGVAAITAELFMLGYLVVSATWINRTNVTRALQKDTS